MASIIRIKRSSVSGNPATLAAGELAYSALTDNGSNGGDRLYIGIGTETAGNAANHFVIGGKFFTDMLDHTKGVLTANSALTVDANSKLDNLKVDNLDLNGNTISSTNTNGDILLTPNGTGKTVITNPYIGDTSTTLTEFIQDVTGGQVTSGNGVDVTYNDTAGTSTVALNTEYAQDLVGAMFTGGTHSGIAATYDDTNGVINLNVADPTITIAGDVDGSATMTNLGNTTINVTLDTVNSNVGQFGSATAIPVLTVNGKGLVTAVTTAAIATTLNITGDTGSDGIALLSETLAIVGGEGIDTAVTANTLTISAEDATTSNKGVASFNSASFDVTSGAVSIKSGGVSNAQLANSSITIGSTTTALGATNTALAGLTELAVDNININGNEISSTNSNGDISLNPNGTGSVAVNGARITGLAAPVNDSDAATKLYVDEVAQGITVKPAVKAATTANLTATYDNGTNGVGSTLTLPAAATLNIDGVTTWAQYDDILVKNQTNAFENGRYVVLTVGNISTPWVLRRCGLCDEPDEIPSMYIFVQQGTLYASTGWVATVEDFGAFDVGVDDITFTQFSCAGTYLAGDGLSITGSTFNVNVANGIEISSDNVQLASTVAGAGLTYSAGVLNVVGTSNRVTVNADSIDIASTYVGQTSITTLGTIATGTWQGTIVSPTYGGTGVNNGTKTITLGGNFTHSGAHTLTLTTTANTNVTLPTTGTLATLAGTETFTNKTLTSPTITGGSINNTPIGATTRNTGAFTTLTANGATTLTSSTASTSTSTGALVVSGGVGIAGSVYVGSNLVGAGAATSVLDGFDIDGGTY